MKKIKALVLAALVLCTVTSCFEDLDDNLSAARDINDFVWKAMNATYVYKDNIPDLFNDRFDTSNDYITYLNNFPTPEDLFASLIYLPDDVDEFSAIVSNYFDLEQFLQGTSLSNGMAFGLVKLSSDSDAIFGYVRYILPNTDAEAKGLTRGAIFNAIDGTLLTTSNYRSLIDQNTYTLGFANYNDNGTPDSTSDDVVTSTDESLTLTKSAYTENPILTHKVFNLNGNSVGYLMYNGFRIGDSNLTELNAVFAEFQSENITDLVLDLRYNGGGSVSTAIWLASMITGQNTGDLFFKEKWNTEIQARLEQTDPESLTNLFVDEMVKRDSNGDITYQQNINSLNLTKVYVLTKGSTASASELVINGLSPYIDVVQIGSTTRGKPQASITLYDSADFRRANANPSHTYALQPLIYESENANGFSEYYDGLNPSAGFSAVEHFDNLGQLGDINEPFLAIALGAITGTGRSFYPEAVPLKEVADDKVSNPISNEMVDNRPLKYN